jgi:hypothetical protein
MKYLAGGALLISGMLIGFFIGQGIGADDGEIAEQPDTEYITELVRDTIIQTEQVEVESDPDKSDTLLSMNDSLFWVADTFNTVSSGHDSADIVEDIHSRRERLIAYKSVALIQLAVQPDKDSTIKEALGIDSPKQTSVSVEFWESPLNYSGYKFSGKKLILYGMSPQLSYKVYRRGDDFFLYAQEVYYRLRETNDFVNYQEVDKEVVFND